MTGRSKNNLTLALIALGTIVAVYFGWRLFWFLTDDAFIAFRYISNSRLGYGYVWNPPPFRPVEGYTSFLWVVLLDLIWRICRIEPPQSANYVSLLFSYLTLLVSALIVMRMRLSDQFERYRILFLGLILAGTITNRTFLAWTSSGLETAMFNFFLTLWIYCSLFFPVGSRRWIFSTAAAVALVYLTRPDGLLFAAATIFLIGYAIFVNPKRSVRDWVKSSLAAAPLLLIPIHLIWRRAFYGEWLPNTYYAKTVAGRFWIESGARYFLSFVIEYSLWIWLIVLMFAIVFGLKRRRDWLRTVQTNFVVIVVCAVVLAHFLYYTIVIGGDHFEYRVYSQLIPLLFISFLWLLNFLHLGSRSAPLLFSLFIVLSWPIPWLHWQATHNLVGRDRTVVLRESLAKDLQRTFPGTPSVVLGYLRVFDNLQSWLIGHSVCVRHQEHKCFYLDLIEILPSRAEGLTMNGSDYPVTMAGSVGVISWVLPRVNIIDGLGLNDFVVARNPHITKPIEMAHERQPPDGYVECFEPNVAIDQQLIVITPRAVPLTSDKIVKCETTYAELLKHPDALMRPAPPVENQIDDPRFFVSQLYRDLFGREPDQNGLEYWANHLRARPSGSYCFNDNRVTLTSVFLNSPEVLQRAAFIYRANIAAFGKPPRLAEFVRDQRSLADLQNVDWRDPNDIGSAHRSFLEAWIKRDDFRAAYPESLSLEDFVSRLFDRAGLKPFAVERERAIADLHSGKSRAAVLEALIDLDQFKRRESANAIVPLQVLLLLRLDVDLNDPLYKSLAEQTNAATPAALRHIDCLFLTSEEYQRRFGDKITHTNAECH